MSCKGCGVRMKNDGKILLCVKEGCGEMVVNLSLHLLHKNKSREMKDMKIYSNRTYIVYHNIKCKVINTY